MAKYNFIKLHTSGNLAGIEIKDSINFVDDRAARKWISAVTNNILRQKLNFTVTNFIKEV